jgi:hypothetical protein
LGRRRSPKQHHHHLLQCYNLPIDIDKTAARTRGSVAGEGAIRKAWSTTVADIDSTTIDCSAVSMRPLMSKAQRTGSSVPHEDAIRKGWSATADSDSTTLACDHISMCPSI